MCCVLFLVCLYICVCKCLLQNNLEGVPSSRATFGFPQYCASTCARFGCTRHASCVDSNWKKMITWIHNEIYKETHEHKLINIIIIMWIHSIHHKIYEQTNKSIRLPLKKTNYCSTCVFFIHAPCFLMCILFYVCIIWLHVYVFAIHSMVQCGSAFEPGASGLPYYCTSICVRSCCTWRASCVDSKPKYKKRNFSGHKKRGGNKKRKSSGHRKRGEKKDDVARQLNKTKMIFVKHK